MAVKVRWTPIMAIHPSAWNWNSANFAFWGFSEVRHSIGPTRVAGFDFLHVLSNLSRLPRNAVRMCSSVRSVWAERSGVKGLAQQPFLAGVRGGSAHI